MSRIEQALARFENGYNCAQAIVSTYCPLFGIEPDQGLVLSLCLGGGVARHGNICGAVSGAAIVLSLKYLSPETRPRQEMNNTTYKKCTEFMDRFSERNENIICSELLGMEIRTEQGLEQALAKDVFNKQCTGYVRAAAELLEEMLNQD